MKHDSDDVLKTANSLCQEEQEVEAELLVKEQLVRDPHNLELMTMLGEIQVRLCKDKEAESVFRSVLDKAPNHENAVCGLGRLLDQTLRTEEAEQIYRNHLQNNPIGHCALEDLCRLLLSEDRAEEALLLARNQIEQYGDDVNSFDALRYVLHILEDQLESDLNDDRENESIFVQLIDNLFEQLELVTTIETKFELHEVLETELNDDRTRLISEIEHLLESAASRKISISEEFDARLQDFK